MSKFLTGIKSTGVPHLGNILSVITNSIELSKSNDSFFFIADLHSLTTIKNLNERNKYVFSVASAWLAFGLDTNKTVFYRQSRVPQICELNWYLNCFTPYSTLSNSHAFKEKISKLHLVNTGLFTYPILMAADILIYNAELVTIGKDQLQHLEIAINLAKKINKTYGNIFTIPKSKLYNNIITGTDGRKMSKNYKNTINIFLPDNLLMKQIMSIVTNSVSVKESKDPNKCNVFNIYKLLSTKYDSDIMYNNYVNGNYSYSKIKNKLFELIVSKFSKERKLFNEYMKDFSLIENKLKHGEELARNIAAKNLSKIKNTLF